MENLLKTQSEEEKSLLEFFACLGEIWRDIAAIEFLMRCAIAKKESQIKQFPMPPYTKGKIYKKYPKSFAIGYFSEVTKKFNKCFPELVIPQKLIDLRNAMAHGLIVEINNRGINELVKFKKSKNKLNELEVEFNMILEYKKIFQLRQSLKNLRGSIMKKCDDNKI